MEDSTDKQPVLQLVKAGLQLVPSLDPKGHSQLSGKICCHLWCFGGACLSQAHMFAYLVPSGCICSGRIRRCGLWEEVCHWGGLCGFRRLSGGGDPQYASLPPTYRIRCEFSIILAAVMDSSPPKQSSLLNVL